MQIRSANVNDAETISALNVNVQMLHAAALSKLFKPPSRDAFPAAMVIELLSNPNTYIYIGQVDGKDVGWS